MKQKNNNNNNNNYKKNFNEMAINGNQSNCLWYEYDFGGYFVILLGCVLQLIYVPQKKSYLCLFFMSLSLVCFCSFAKQYGNQIPI